MRKQKPKKRPPHPLDDEAREIISSLNPHDRDQWTSGMERFENIVTQQKTEPIYRAREKFVAFVNGCVGDQDFKNSPEFLHFLIVVRDTLTKDATYEWKIDDYLEPVRSFFNSQNRAPPLLKVRCQREYLDLIKNEKVAKINFAYSFINEHGEGSLPEAKTIADVWLSNKALAALKNNPE